MTGYLPREMAARIARVAQRLPVVVLSGLRQAGKSTLLQREETLAAGRTYRTLDDFATLAAARANPESLLTGACTIDEVQRCPELLLAVKRSVDEGRVPGRFILSGSANLALLGHVAETLAGRAAYVALNPMTRREIQVQTAAAPFLIGFVRDQSLPTGPAAPVTDEQVLLGGLPPVCLASPEGADEWFRGYIQTYVERDVRQLSQVADLVAFRTLAQLAGLRTGQVVAISDLARHARLSAATAGRYLDLLEASFVVRRVPPYLRNRSTRLVKSPKLYVTDSGLAAHLAGIETIGPDSGEAMRGALYETYAGANLSALLEAHLPGARLAFWHEQGRHEVDFVVEVGQSVLAIEVKAASRWAPSDLAGLRAFVDRTPHCKAAILAYNGTQAVALGDRLYAIPLGHLLA